MTKTYKLIFTQVINLIKKTANDLSNLGKSSPK